MAEQLRCCFLVGSATKRVEHFATSLPQERQISLLEYDLNLSILQEWESISRRFQMKWAPQVCLMRGAKPILLAVILLSMSFSSGCIGLLAGRELMEWTRGVPEREEVVDVYGFDHSFDSTDPSDVIFNPEPRQIRIDSEVKEMRIFFRVEMDFSEVAGFETGNFTNAVRYVDAKLWEPGANKLTDEPYWQENATSDRYPPQERKYPPFTPGVWELEVTAQGYGVDTPIEQLSFHDNFEVSVSVVRPCIEYPERADPNECIPV